MYTADFQPPKLPPLALEGSWATELNATLQTLSYSHDIHPDSRQPTITHTFNRLWNSYWPHIDLSGTVHLASKHDNDHKVYECSRRSALPTAERRSNGMGRVVFLLEKPGAPPIPSISAAHNTNVRGVPRLPLKSYYCYAVRQSPCSISGSSGAGSIDEKEWLRCTTKLVRTYSHKVATLELLETFQRRHPLPPLAGRTHWLEWRYLRMTFYRRLMTVVLLANMGAIAGMSALGRQHLRSFTYEQAAVATGANLLASVLMRQEHILNTLFHMACALPFSIPLQMRRYAAKVVYNNGGIHAGAGVSAVLWYACYIVLLTQQFKGTPGQEDAMSATAAISIILLVTIIMMSHPRIRSRYHDAWELSHRYCGWTTVGLIWTQSVIISIAHAHRSQRPVGLTLVSSPSFWFLIVITCCLIYPWLWLRRLPVNAQQHSSHATQLRFTNRTVPTCVSTRISRNPLLDNHGFATIGNQVAGGDKGYSVLISNAGDFTKSMINNPPSNIWIRGYPTTGVMRLSALFKPIVIVATGSGIGPCLSFFVAHPHHPMRIIWSARSPETTYDHEVLNKVLRADRRALVIDTKHTGHPDLVGLTYAMVKEVAAEAVMIISNPKLTRDVVFAMEARGIAAFGAIFDS